MLSLSALKSENCCLLEKLVELFQLPLERSFLTQEMNYDTQFWNSWPSNGAEGWAFPLLKPLSIHCKQGGL